MAGNRNEIRTLHHVTATVDGAQEQERGETRKARRGEFLNRARERFEQTLSLEPENATAHYNLDLIYKQLGDADQAKIHFDLYRKYKVDDNARDRAVAAARPEAFELGGGERLVAPYELRSPVEVADAGGAEALQ